MEIPGQISAEIDRPARLVEFSPMSGHAKVWLLCQPSPRATELRIDLGTDDQNTQEGKRSLFLIEIQTPSGGLQKFPLVAYNFGPDGRVAVLQPKFRVVVFFGCVWARRRRPAVANGQGRRTRFLASHRHGGGKRDGPEGLQSLKSGCVATKYGT